MNDSDPITHAALTLSTGSPAEMKSALAPLADSPDPRAIGVLVKALGAPSWHVRRLASSILIEFGDRVMDELEHELEIASLDQAYWICHTLARLGPRADMILMGLIKSDKPDHRRYAIHNLAKRKGDGAVLALIEALDDPLWANRRRAAEVLARRPDKKATAALIKQDMAQGARNRISWGVRLLSQILGDGSVAMMSKLAGHADDDVRFLAIEALGDLKAPACVRVLIPRLADSNEIVRDKASEVLASFGTRIVAPLGEAIRGGKPDLQLLGLKTLFPVAPEVALEIASDLFARSKLPTRYAVVQACAAFPSPRTAPLLLQAFQDPIWMVRKTASIHLASAGRPAVSVLDPGLGHESEEVKFWCIATLGSLGPAGLGLLQRLLEKGDRDQRGFAIDALTAGDLRPEAIQLLIERLDDRCWPVRRQAASALVSAGPMVTPQIIREVQSPRENVRYWSRQVLREMFPDRIDPLLAYLEEADEAKQTRLLSRLADLPPHELEGMIRADISKLLKSLGG